MILSTFQLATLLAIFLLEMQTVQHMQRCLVQHGN